MEAPALMEAQTVPTSARYIDKLTTVGTCSTSRENEATRTFSHLILLFLSLSSSVPESNPFNVTCGLGCTTTHQTGTLWPTVYQEIGFCFGNFWPKQNGNTCMKENCLLNILLKKTRLCQHEFLFRLVCSAYWLFSADIYGSLFPPFSFFSFWLFYEKINEWM